MTPKLGLPLGSVAPDFSPAVGAPVGLTIFQPGLAISDSAGAWDALLIGVASFAKPSLSAVAFNPILSFGLRLEAGNFLGMAARPDHLYAPFVTNLEGLVRDCDLANKFGHARFKQ
jgi:hypothetical protein